MTSLRARARSKTRALIAAGALLAALLFLQSSARARNYYVSPTGSGSDCTHDAPCPLAYGATNAQAGDYVVLLDGTYTNQPLIPVNSGTASAWITFIADPGAVPILDGTGSTTPYADGSAMPTTGIGSDTSTYVQFIGLVARNWASGFSNEWTGSTTEFTANGNWKYINCIGDGNTRNGFAFNSTKGVTIHQCISAHNGTSTTSSWSSGFQLYAVQGSASDNVVDENVAFENMDNQKHTDGSGFIVDTMVTGVAFINNLAFLNGGSCIRLTKSTGIQIINNTCYHNGRDTADTGPTNPGEIYFTDGGQTSGLTFVNNVGVATGSTQDPTAAWVWNGGMGSITIASNNKTSATFVASDGTNPDFHLASGSPLINAGTSTSAPGSDIGFDPKCITKAKPTGIAAPSWSAYSIDYTYIKSVGGVAGCWQPGKRPSGSGIDIGAYESGATPVTGTGGSIPPSTGGSGGNGAGGHGGASASGGASGASGGASGASGGASGASGGASGASGGASGASGGASGATGGTSGSSGGASGSTGGASGSTGGSSGAGGTVGASGGSSGTGSGGNLGSGGNGSGGNSASSGGNSGSGGTTGSGGNASSGGSSGTGGGTGGQGPSSSGATTSGCSCATSQTSDSGAPFATLLIGFAAMHLRRRRRVPS
jgi:MYXO-CTERM domain-containing protein